jgi:molybdate transport system substrate-binding protein
MRRRLTVLLAAALLAALVAGCGSSGGGELRVSAAASLRRAFTQYSRAFKPAHVRLSFAGSDALAAQIEEGIRPDVFASANRKLPQQLFARGLVERPTVFAANRLVLAVPRSSRLRRLSDLERPGVSIATGSATVPVGAYTAIVLARLPAAQRRLVLANIRDREPDVTGIVGKLAEGAVDAGFLYATDVVAGGGSIRAIQLPASLQPQVAYAITVVKGSAHAGAARAFVAGLLSGPGRAALLGDGFLAPSPG